MLLVCFAIKSVSIFIYGGILYAASGIIFPLPTAIAVKIAGTVIMTSIPYFIGRKNTSMIHTGIISAIALQKRMPSFDDSDVFGILNFF